MIHNEKRIGNFTSSEIVALTTRDKKGLDFGEAALTYIAETNMERRLNRSLTDEVNAKPLVWGKLLEAIAFDLLGMEYTLSSTETDMHPEINYWAGSKDGTKPRTVLDIKSPYTLKSFCQLVDPLYDGLEGMDAMNALRFGYTDGRGLFHKKHKDGEKFFYQLVSNSILTNSEYAELIIYMPFESEVEEIKLAANGRENAHFMAFAQEGELPCLKEGGDYNNINIIRFEVPQEAKDFLTESVLRAGKLLIPRPSVLLAERDDTVNATIVENA